MSPKRFLLLVAAALIAISAALVLASRRDSVHETAGGALLPGLSANLNSVTEVTLRKGGGTATSTIQKSAGGWTLKERDGYPADVAKLRSLLTALGDARIAEEKTADPARYPVIGVEDLAQPGATGTEITVSMPGARQDVIVGKSAADGNFVRRAGEKQSYSVTPVIPTDGEPHYWIDSLLIDVPATKIQRIEFKPPAGAPYAIHRSAADGPFSLDGAPAGRKPLPAEALAPAPTTFTGLAAEDVAPQGSIDFGQPFVTTVTLTDGGVLTLTGTVAGTKHWVEITSSKDPALAAKAQGRAFEVASYRYDAIFKPLEQLLTPREPPAAKETAAKAHKPSTK